MKYASKSGALVLSLMFCVAMVGSIINAPIASGLIIHGLPIVSDTYRLRDVVVKAGIETVSVDDISKIRYNNPDAPADVLASIESAERKLAEAQDKYAAVRDKLAAYEMGEIGSLVVGTVAGYKTFGKVFSYRLTPAAHGGYAAGQFISTGPYKGMVVKKVLGGGRLLVGKADSGMVALLPGGRLPIATSIVFKATGIIALTAFVASVVGSAVARGEIEAVASSFVGSARDIISAASKTASITISRVAELEKLGVNNYDVCDYIDISEYEANYAKYTDIIGHLQSSGSSVSVSGGVTELNRYVPSSASKLTPTVRDIIALGQALEKAAKMKDANQIEEGTFVTIVDKVSKLIGGLSSVCSGAAADIAGIKAKFTEKISEIESKISGAENAYNLAVEKGVNNIDATVISTVNNARTILRIGAPGMIISATDVTGSPKELMDAAMEAITSAKADMRQVKTIFAQAMGFYGAKIVEKLENVEDKMDIVARYISKAEEDTQALAQSLKNDINNELPSIKDRLSIAENELGVSYVIVSLARNKINSAENYFEVLKTYEDKGDWGNAALNGANSLYNIAVANNLLEQNTEELRVLGKEVELLIDKLENVVTNAFVDGIDVSAARDMLIEAKRALNIAYDEIRGGELRTADDIIDKILEAKTKAETAKRVIDAKYLTGITQLTCARDNAKIGIEGVDLMIQEAEEKGIVIPQLVKDKVSSLKNAFTRAEQEYVTLDAIDIGKVAGKLNQASRDYSEISDNVKNLLSENPMLITSVLDYDVDVMFPQGITSGVPSSTKLSIFISNTLNTHIPSFPIKYTLDGQITSDIPPVIDSVTVRAYYDPEKGTTELLFRIPPLAPRGQEGSHVSIVVTFDAVIIAVEQTELAQFIPPEDNMAPPSERPIQFYTIVTVKPAASFDSTVVSVAVPTQTILEDTITAYTADNIIFEVRPTIQSQNNTIIPVEVVGLTKGENLQFVILFEEPAPTVRIETSSVRQVKGENDIIFDVSTDKVSVKNVADVDLENVWVGLQLPGGIDLTNWSVEYAGTVVDPHLDVADSQMWMNYPDNNLMLLVWKILKIPAGTDVPYTVSYGVKNIYASCIYMLSTLDNLILDSDNLIKELEKYGFNMVIDKDTLQGIQTNRTAISQHINNNEYLSAFEPLRVTISQADELYSGLTTLLTRYLNVKEDIDMLKIEKESKVGYAQTLLSYSEVASAAQNIFQVENEVDELIRDAIAAVAAADIDLAEGKISEARTWLETGTRMTNEAVGSYLSGKLLEIEENIKKLNNDYRVLQGLNVGYLFGVEPLLEEARKAKDDLSESIKSVDTYLKALVDARLAENKIAAVKSKLDESAPVVALSQFDKINSLAQVVISVGTQLQNELAKADNAVLLTYTAVPFSRTYTENDVKVFKDRWTSSYKAVYLNADTIRQTALNYYNSRKYFDLFTLVNNNSKILADTHSDMERDVSLVQTIIATLKKEARNNIATEEEKLQSVRVTIKQAEASGVDVSDEKVLLSSAETLIEQAKTSEKNANYTNASAYAKDAASKLDKIRANLGYYKPPPPGDPYTVIAIALIVVVLALFLVLKKKGVFKRGVSKQKLPEEELFEVPR